MSKNMAERPQVTLLRCVTCWISKATRAQTHSRARAPTPTHAEVCTTLISFPRLQWLKERASVLRLSSLVYFSVQRHQQ